MDHDHTEFCDHHFVFNEEIHMRKGMLGIAIAMFAALFALSAGADLRAAEQVRLNTIRRQYAPPPLNRKEGLLAVSNRDWKDYTLVITKKGRFSLYRGDTGYAGYQSYPIPAGSTVYIALEKSTWELSAENRDRLKVKIREGRTSTLSLNPFGFRGNTGLMGVTNDGERAREQVLFDNYTRPVVVQPPTIVVPPPPPVVVRPPVVVVDPPRPYPQPPPRRHGSNWGFSFDFGR